MTANYFMADLAAGTLSSHVDVDWSDAVLFTPYHNNQALLYQCANCVAVRTFLKMAELPFRIEERPNTEFMSPSGKAPFLKLQSIIVPEFGPIVKFISNKGISLSTGLTDVQRADMHAHMSLFDEILQNAEMYIMWADERNYSQVTKQRYGSVYFWPLNSILPFKKRREVLAYLDAIDWGSKKESDVIELADRSFKSLSSKLSHNEYFLGDAPTELDALAFGHLFTILTTELPNMELTNCLRRYPNLLEFCQRIDHQYFTIQSDQ